MNALNGIVSSFFTILRNTFPLAILIFIIWLYINLSKKKSKIQKYRNFSIILLGLGCSCVLMISINYLGNFFSKSSFSSSNVADGFTIESYNVKLNVKENNVVDVTEKVTVKFYEAGHHGIYRFVPTSLEYTGKDGITISRKSEVENLKAIGDEYSLDIVNGKKRIKIGSPNYTLTQGLKTYTISYQYVNGKDPFYGFDEFIFHTFGDYWGTTINNPSIEITMPKEIDEKSIKFFSDKYRNNDISSYVDYYVIGNTLYARVSSSYDLRKSLTVDIELPEGYFVGDKSNHGYFSMVSCFLIILFAIITFIKWLRHGKDYDKYSETIEFYSPEGYDSASIGYIYKKDSGKKLAISIIVELASKGFIRIDKSEDKSKIIITNLYPVDINKAINRQISITKIKDPTSSSDQDIMRNLFPNNSDSAIITDKFEEFYSSAKNLISKGYIQINSDSIDIYTKKALENITNQIREKSLKERPKMTSNEQLVYNQLFVNSDENVLSNDKEFYKVFSKITENLESELDYKINDINSYINMVITSILFFIGSVYFFLAFNIIEDLNPKFQILYLFTFISLIIIFILAIFMKRKNTYGEQILAKVKGFKNYLETAEKDQLNKLVNDNPNYFYDILPYTYVLGVSKKWIEKFENIPIPQNDMGNFDYANIDSFNILYAYIYSPPSSTSSGCSSCGGGCSSCGGGGSW